MFLFEDIKWHFAGKATSGDLPTQLFFLKWFISIAMYDQLGKD